MAQRRIPQESGGSAPKTVDALSVNAKQVAIAGELLGSPDYAGVYENLNSRNAPYRNGISTTQPGNLPLSTQVSYSLGWIGPGFNFVRPRFDSPTTTTTFNVSAGIKGITNDVFDSYGLGTKATATEPFWTWTETLTSSESASPTLIDNTELFGVRRMMYSNAYNRNLFPTLSPSATLYVNADPTAAFTSFRLEIIAQYDSLSLGQSLTG